MKKPLSILLLILTVACSRAPTPTLTPTSPPLAVALTLTSPARTAVALTTTAPAVTVVPPTPAEPSVLNLTASDGARLAASFYPPVLVSQGAGEKAPGVLLLHMLGGGRSDWEAFARELQKQGLAALALDLRGHGESAGPADWEKSPGDVRTAWDVLVARPEVDAERSAIVGASIGANLALIVGANNADVVTVVALSPGLDYHGLKPSSLMSNFGQRPILLVASQDDPYSYDSARQLASLASAGETHYFADAGHGTQMFGNPELAPRMLGWLLNYVGILKG